MMQSIAYNLQAIDYIGYCQYDIDAVTALLRAYGSCLLNLNITLPYLLVQNIQLFERI